MRPNQTAVKLYISLDFKKKSEELNINLTKVLNDGIEREIKYLQQRGGRYKSKGMNDIIVTDLPAGGIEN